MNRSELLVVGAGPAGSATVLGWLAGGRSAPVWISTARAPTVRGAESLPPDVPALLNELGAAAALRSARTSHGVASAWESSVPGYSDFFTGGTGHGWQVDRCVFDASLVRHATARGATLRADSLTQLLRDPAGGYTYTLASGVEGHAQRVVDASGRRGVVARALHVHRRSVDRLVAVVGVLDLADPGIRRVHIEAAQDHWWYMGPLPGGKAAIALFADSDIVQAEGYSDPSTWVQRLRETELVNQTVHVQLPNDLHVKGASTGSLETAGDGTWLAVGDAFCTFDPLSSAGIGKALASARAATRVLLGHLAMEAYEHDQTKAFEAYLDQRRHHYSRVRRFDHHFWQRRSQHLWMAPQARLQPGAHNRPVRDVALSGREWRTLWRELSQPRLASELVNTMRATPTSDDRRRVEALQSLVRQGVLARV